MKRKMVIAVLVCAFFSFGGEASADMEMRGHDLETISRIHQVNRLIGRAMGMVTEGASLVLVANLQLAPPTDPFTAQEGMKMIANGKDLVRMALGGEGMTAMKRKEMEDDSMMRPAENLGEAILRYIDLVENMEMSGPFESRVRLHRTHLMVNHALDMAAEGANLAMLGDLKLAEVLDKYSVERGRMMLREARATLSGLSGSQDTAMTEMIEDGMGSMGGAMKNRTGEFIKTALGIIDALEKMATQGGM